MGIILFLISYFSYKLYSSQEISISIGAMVGAVAIGFIDYCHRSTTPLLSIDENVIYLDQGFFKKLLVINLHDLENINGDHLNNELIRIILKLKSGDEVYYRPSRLCDTDFLELILLKIKEEMVSYKT